MILEVTNLQKQYRQIKALRGVSLTVCSGQITGLLGPNACGKTTLIKSILGLVLPDAGEIKWSGENISGRWDYRKKLGYMPQNPDFPSNLKVSELLNMLEDLRGTKAPQRDELVRLFDLGSTLERPFGVLSGGTKQKVAAVTAFMFNPEILILDEPTVGLDPSSAYQLKQLMKQAVQGGSAVLLVSHIVSEMEQLVDSLVFVVEGQVQCSGSVESIKKQAAADTLEAAIITLFSKVGRRHA